MGEEGCGESVSPLEHAIRRALTKQSITVASLAAKIGMAPTNFSLARHGQRRMPFSALLKMLELANLTADEKMVVIEWVVFDQEIGGRGAL